MKKMLLTFFFLSFINLNSNEITPLIINYKGADIYGDTIIVYGGKYSTLSTDGGDNWIQKKLLPKNEIKKIIKYNRNYLVIDNKGKILFYNENLNKINDSLVFIQNEEDEIHTVKHINNLLFIRTYKKFYRINLEDKNVIPIDLQMPVLSILDKNYSNLFTIFKNQIYLPFDDRQYEERRLLKYDLDLTFLDTIKYSKIENRTFLDRYNIDSDENSILYLSHNYWLTKTKDFQKLDTLYNDYDGDIIVKLHKDEFYYCYNQNIFSTRIDHILYKIENDNSDEFSKFPLKDSYLRSYNKLDRYIFSEKYLVRFGVNTIMISLLDSNSDIISNNVYKEFGSIYFYDYSLPHQLTEGRIMAVGGFDNNYQKELYYSDNNGETFHPLLDTSNQKYKNYVKKLTNTHLFYQNPQNNSFYFINESNFKASFHSFDHFLNIESNDLNDNISATNNQYEKLEVKLFNNKRFFKYHFKSSIFLHNDSLKRLFLNNLFKQNSTLQFSSLLNENFDFIFFRDCYNNGNYELTFNDTAGINEKLIKTIDYENYYNYNTITVNGLDYIGLCYFDSLKNKVVYEIMNCQTQEFTTLKEIDFETEEVENYKKTALYYFEGKLYFAFLNSLFTIEFDKLNTNIWNELKFRDNGRIVKNMRMLNNILFAYYSDDYNSEAIYKLENLDFTSSVENIEEYEIPTISILNLFPNPSDNTVELSLNFDQRYDINNTEVSLYYINGIKANNLEYKILKQSSYNSKIIIDLSNIVKGAYIINLNLGNQNITRKFVKN